MRGGSKRGDPLTLSVNIRHLTLLNNFSECVITKGTTASCDIILKSIN